jgi:hypothetical protein
VTDHERASHREELIEALRQAGMKASTFTGSDGKTYVIIPLLDTRVSPMINAAKDPELRSYFKNAASRWPSLAYLFICSGSSTPPWEVGVIGHNGETDEDYTPNEWVQSSSTGDAVEQFRKMWRNRDTLLNAFVGDMLK